MRNRWLLLVMPVLLWVAVGLAGADGGEDDPAAAPPPRVVVRMLGRKPVAGHLEFEDQHVLVVRDGLGKLHAFARSRVADIQRLVDPEPGQRGVIHLTDGQRLEGVVLEDAFTHVRLEIEGVATRVPRDRVGRVELYPTFEQRYLQLKETVKPGMVDRHIALCRWLVEQGRYEVARDELIELDTYDDTGAGRRLRQLVEAQLTLLAHDAVDEGDPGEAGVADDPGDGAEATGPVGLRDMLPSKMVSSEDVNIVRVFEVDLDRPPKLAVPPETIRTLIERYGSNGLMPATDEGRNALFNADPARVVELMFRLRARELYDQIEVLSEPHALNLFRQNVHNTWLINTCATSRCHGGGRAGRFFLHRQDYRDARVRTTNLLILERLRLEELGPLVDYQEPVMSVIVQHALPRSRARMPHPDVPGWHPVFTRTSETLLERTLEWIGAMMQPRPDYPVEYDPPRLDAGQRGVEADPGRVPR